MNIEKIIERAAGEIAGAVKKIGHQVKVNKAMDGDRMLGVLSPKVRGRIFWYKLIDPCRHLIRRTNQIVVTYSCVDGSRQDAVVVPSKMNEDEAVHQIANHFMQEYAAFLQDMGS
jgi:hypothetical protein